MSGATGETGETGTTDIKIVNDVAITLNIDIHPDMTLGHLVNRILCHPDWISSGREFRFCLYDVLFPDLGRDYERCSRFSFTPSRTNKLINYTLTNLLLDVGIKYRIIEHVGCSCNIHNDVELDNHISAEDRISDDVDIYQPYVRGIDPLIEVIESTTGLVRDLALLICDYAPSRQVVPPTKSIALTIEASDYYQYSDMPCVYSMALQIMGPGNI
jgi:hypothetical protein